MNRQVITRIVPRQYMYPTLSCIIFYGEDFKKLKTFKIMKTRKECKATIDSIRDKIDELYDEIKYVKIKALDRGCPLVEVDELIGEEIYECLDQLIPLYDTEFDIFGEDGLA